MDKEKIYIYYRESFVQSVLSDIFSFGLAIFLLYVNHAYLGDKTFVAVFFLIIWTITMLSIANSKGRRFTNKKDLKDWIESTP